MTDINKVRSDVNHIPECSESSQSRTEEQMYNHLVAIFETRETELITKLQITHDNMNNKIDEISKKLDRIESAISEIFDASSGRRTRDGI